MKRGEFERAIQAAGAVVGVDEVLVMGSQALHATIHGALPDEAARSVEVDVAARGDEEGRLADLAPATCARELQGWHSGTRKPTYVVV
ncbi:MAG: hypothetical protein AMXMBFR53_35610 [Gemmatimonadota bacterium]